MDDPRYWGMTDADVQEEIRCAALGMEGPNAKSYRAMTAGQFIPGGEFTEVDLARIERDRDVPGEEPGEDIYEWLRPEEDGDDE